MAPVIEGGRFAFHGFDMNLVYSAQEALRRATAGLRPVAADDARRQRALKELKRASADAEKYLTLLDHAVTTAMGYNRNDHGADLTIKDYRYQATAEG